MCTIIFLGEFQVPLKTIIGDKKCACGRIS